MARAVRFTPRGGRELNPVRFFVQEIDAAGDDVGQVRKLDFDLAIPPGGVIGKKGDAESTLLLRCGDERAHVITCHGQLLSCPPTPDGEPAFRGRARDGEFGIWLEETPNGVASPETWMRVDDEPVMRLVRLAQTGDTETPHGTWSLPCGDTHHNVLIGPARIELRIPLPAGRYRVEAVWYGQTIGPETVTIEPDRDTPVTLEQHCFARLTGRVTVAGNPAPGAEVAVKKKPTGDNDMVSGERTLHADVYGRFYLDMLTAGPKTVYVTFRVTDTLVRTIRELPAPLLARRFGVSEEEAAAIAADLTVESLSTLIGIAPGTDFRREFDLDSRSWADPPGPHAAELEVRGPSITEKEVAEGAVRDLGVVELDAGGRCRVVVVDESGAPIEGAEVAADLRRFIDPPRYGITGPDGSCVFRGFQEGSLDIEVRKEGFAKAQILLIPDWDDDGVDRELLIRKKREIGEDCRFFREGASKDMEVRVVMRPPPVIPTVAIRFAADPGHPDFDPVTFMLYRYELDMWMVRGGYTDGKELPIRFLRYRLVMHADEKTDDGDVRYFYVGDFDLDEDPRSWNIDFELETRNGDPSSITILPRFERAFTIEGRVFEAGRPVRGASVAIVPSNDWKKWPLPYIEGIFTDDQGRFRVAIPATSEHEFVLVRLDDRNACIEVDQPRFPGGKGAMRIDLD